MSDESDDEPLPGDPEPAADPPSPSLASSAAPQPQGQQVAAQQLANHPVWQASRGSGKGGGNPRPAAVFNIGGRGRGRGRSRAGSENGDVVNAPRFERISMAALEAGQYEDGDGADSRIESEDDPADHFERIRRMDPPPPKKKRKKGPRNEDGDDDESDDDDDDDDGERRSKLAGLMGAAAFGGGGQRRGRYAESEDGSMPSAASSARRREAYKDAFPVRGVTCVGCALANRIGPVNRFVRDNISQMTEDALWKMAALTYKREVAEPTEREGAPVPQWGWKEVRVHYELHATGNFVARHKMVRSLQCMRQQQEERLVRVDNGEKELDRQGADLMLKVRSQLLMLHPIICHAYYSFPTVRRSWPRRAASASSSSRVVAQRNALGRATATTNTTSHRTGSQAQCSHTQTNRG